MSLNDEICTFFYKKIASSLNWINTETKTKVKLLIKQFVYVFVYQLFILTRISDLLKIACPK